MKLAHHILIIGGSGYASYAAMLQEALDKAVARLVLHINNDCSLAGKELPKFEAPQLHILEQSVLQIARTLNRESLGGLLEQIDTAAEMIREVFNESNFSLFPEPPVQAKPFYVKVHFDPTPYVESVKRKQDLQFRGYVSGRQKYRK